MVTAGRPRLRGTEVLPADDAQQLQPLRRVRTRVGGVDQQQLVLAAGRQDFAVEVEPADHRVQEGLAAAAPDGDVVPLPVGGELLAGGPQPVEQGGEVPVPGPGGVGRAQVGDVGAGEGVVLLGREEGAGGGVGEPADRHVAQVGRPVRRVAEERGGHRVLGEDVADVRDDLGRGVVQAVQDQQQAGPDVAQRAVPARRFVAGQVEEVVAFVVGQA